MEQGQFKSFPRILVVEDHRDSREAMAKLLRFSGYGVCTAGCVAEALRAAERETIDLVVCDLTLPDGNGSELIRELSQRRPVAAIAVTGHTDEANFPANAQAGFCERLTKPVQLPILLAAIKNATRSHRHPEGPRPERRA